MLNRGPPLLQRQRRRLTLLLPVLVLLMMMVLVLPVLTALPWASAHASSCMYEIISDLLRTMALGCQHSGLTPYAVCTRGRYVLVCRVGPS